MTSYPRIRDRNSEKGISANFLTFSGNIVRSSNFFHALFCPKLKKVPVPAGAQIQILGSQNGSWGRKYQICVLNNHAETSGRYSKRSHMLQVTAETVLGHGPPRRVYRELFRPLAHKGPIGDHHGGPTGGPNWSRNPGRSRK